MRRSKNTEDFRDHFNEFRFYIGVFEKSFFFFKKIEQIKTKETALSPPLALFKVETYLCLLNNYFYPGKVL